MELKGEIAKSIIIVGLQYLLSASDRIAREKISIEILRFNNTMN